MSSNNKKKKSGNALLIVIIIICIGVAAFAAYKLISIGLAYKAGEDEYARLQKYTYETNKPDPTDSEDKDGDDADTDAATDEEVVKPPIEVDFEELKAINPDFAGWLYVGAEDISYPVVYSGDNDYYLHRTFERADNFAGTLFIEAKNKPDFNDPNTIIYGHNMKNQSMFGKLKFIYEFEDYKNDDEFWILTENGSYRYKMFNMEVTKATSDVYTLFSGPGELVKDYISDRMAESYVSLPIESYDENSKVVTLSTCSANDDERFVVQGILVGVY